MPYKPSTPDTTMERVVYMACVSADFLQALCDKTTKFVARLERAGMKFSPAEKKLLANARYDHIAAHRMAFLNITTEHRAYYENMAKQILEDPYYTVPPLSPQCLDWMIPERTRGIRPGR